MPIHLIYEDIKTLPNTFAEISVYYLYCITLINRLNIIHEGVSERKSDNLCDVLCDPTILAPTVHSLPVWVLINHSSTIVVNYLGVTSSILGCYFWHCLLFQN